MSTISIPSDAWARIEKQVKECLDEARKYGLERYEMVDLVRWAGAWKEACARFERSKSLPQAAAVFHVDFQELQALRDDPNK